MVLEGLLKDGRTSPQRRTIERLIVRLPVSPLAIRSRGTRVRLLVEPMPRRTWLPRAYLCPVSGGAARKSSRMLLRKPSNSSMWPDRERDYSQVRPTLPS